MSYGNRQRSSAQAVQKLLDENAQLIQAIVDYQNKGKAAECVQYQQLLHKNLVYLASLADGSQNIQALLPPPPVVNQVAGNSPGPSLIIQGNNLPSNAQERRLSPMDQNPAAAMPNMMSQAMTSGSMMPSGMHAAPAMTTTGNVGVQSMTGSPPVAGYSGNPNPSVSQSIPPTSQSVLPGQQGYMPGMHPVQTHPMPQSQQFMMQQNVAMGTYNRGQVQQMHQQILSNQQSYMQNQGAGNQPTPGMVPYQQSATNYDPYNQMQHIYNHPYGAQ